MINRIINKILKWHYGRLLASFDSINNDEGLFMHKIIKENPHEWKKLLKIHYGSCIENYSNNEKDKELIHNVIFGLENFVKLYYNTIENGTKDN